MCFKFFAKKTTFPKFLNHKDFFFSEKLLYFVFITKNCVSSFFVSIKNKPPNICFKQGLEHEKDQEPILFGEYEYADNGASWQYFSVQNKEIRRPYEIVELRIESNHGHPLYTCLYRFRVHGKPPAA